MLRFLYTRATFLTNKRVLRTFTLREDLLIYFQLSMCRSQTQQLSHNREELKTVANEEEDDDEEEEENSDSEDDPDRLWCICKRPHNNRFMICCDVCEDWFHGKCVHVSKAMGKYSGF